MSTLKDLKVQPLYCPDGEYYLSEDNVKKKVLEYLNYLYEHDSRCNITTKLVIKYKEIFGDWEK